MLLDALDMVSLKNNTISIDGTARAAVVLQLGERSLYLLLSARKS